MDADALIRRLGLGAIPVLGLLGYWLRSEPPAASSSSVASAMSAAAAPPAAPSSSSAFAGFEFGKGIHQVDGDLGSSPAVASAAFSRTRTAAKQPPAPKPLKSQESLKPPASMAVDLPVATGPPVAPAKHLAGGPCGGVQVRAITASRDPQWSFAAIASGPSSPARVRHRGDSVGSWRVQSIEWDRVWLASAGKRCAVGMHAGARTAREAAGDAAGMRLIDDAADGPPRWHVPLAVAQAIHKRSETEYYVTDAGIGAIFKRAAELLSGLRLEPVRRQAQVVGIELGAVAPDSLLDRLGVESGDIVFAINNEPCATLRDTITALQLARDAGRLVAQMERRGEPFDLDIQTFSAEAG